MGIKAWITVNGQHIPIMDGESKIQAVGRFIKSKRHGADMRMKEMERELSGDLPYDTKDIYNEYNKQAAIYQRYGGGKTIKGRAKTKEQRDKDWFDTYKKSKKEDLAEMRRERVPWDRETRVAVAESNAEHRANTMLENRYRNNKQIGKAYKLKADTYKFLQPLSPRQSIPYNYGNKTGFKDKNGRELKVGDIVQGKIWRSGVQRSPEKQSMNLLVKQDKKTGKYFLETPVFKDRKGITLSKDMKVVGKLDIKNRKK